MRGNWYHVAKAEFLIQTSKFRHKRRIVFLSILALGIVWAFYIVPYIMSLIVSLAGAEISALLALIFPGLMRSIVLFLWISFVVYPMSSALQEIKIGQWEVMLTNNVSTRSIMTGTYVGRLPVYGLITLFVAPVVLSPFAIIFRVSLTGQIIMYLTILFVALGTLWLANLLTTAIQAKLGESPRGNDLAKALSIGIAVLIIVPMYGIMYFAPGISGLLGGSLFLLFPFTWGADLVTWTVISFNGIGLTPPVISFFESILQFNWLIDLSLLVTFTLGIVAIAFSSADRIFKVVAGARSEKIVTVGRDGLLLRGIGRVGSGSGGILFASAWKDFTRKAQNIAQLIYGVLLAIILPFLTNFAGAGEKIPEIGRLLLPALMMGLMMAIIAGMTFGGIGFLDSKDQLWMITSAPNGVRKFIKAKVEVFLILSVFIVAAPSVIVAVGLGLPLIEFLMLYGNTLLAVCGATLIGVGIAASNPAYDDTKSPAFTRNRMYTTFTIMGVMMTAFFALMFLFESFNVILVMLSLSVPVFLVGLAVVYVGAHRMSRPQ